MSLASTPACPTYGQCSIQIDEDTCLFLSLKPQFLFNNSVCAEVPNGTLHAFKLPANTDYYFYPPTLFYPHPGHCKYFDRAKDGNYATLKYRNAWLIVGVDTENETSSEKIIRLHLQHAVTKQEDMIRYRITNKKLEPIENYTVIKNYTVLEEVYARNPSKDNPLAILVYLWDDMQPQHEWQHVRTFAELSETDAEDSLSSWRKSRATCVFPSLNKLYINECTEYPCKNGICKNTHGSYECICFGGWIGKHCETDVNECDYPNICGPKGTCENTVGSFLCICPAGLTGKHCDSDVEECLQQPNPCEPNGKCFDTFGSYVCHCLSGWTGKHCTSDIDECVSGQDRCFNDGTCVNTIGSYICRCKESWTGPKCREAVDLCKKLDCVNGLCVAKENVSEVECKCYMGWSGEACTVDKDECQETKDLCLNNGVCSDPKGNYTCTYINECANADCINGYCTDLVNGHKCDCYIGFTGANCAVELSPCEYLSYDCGKGSCLPDGNLPHCECTPGYTGIHCEQGKSQSDAPTCSRNA
ncbi:EGF CA and hEGF domain containing protein [Trichuris trichiura]|uniref:EGF CA and hEGF domain containing protein n=1 Tax=Trichuris trichiura TaxID=36087 RepID=A0A077ZIT8_TRITR|nr:EGF CA and hEGF domain containing protein [Trichuris trichiura]